MKKLFSFAFLLATISVQAQTQWYDIPSNTTAHLRAIDFPSISVGYIVGDSGVMLKSTDGGQNWNPLSYSGIPFTPDFTDVEFLDELNGFVVVKQSTGSFYKTSDGGVTWASNTSQSSMCDKRCVYVFNQDDYFVAGAGCFQSAMIDEHDNLGWTEKTINYQTFDPSNYVVELAFSGNVGIAALNHKYILRSVDAGQTWDSIPTGISEQGVHTSAFFADAQTCYVGYDDGSNGFGVLVSYDAGATWEQDINSATFFYPAYYGYAMADNGDLYCGARPSFGGNGLIFEKIGNTWDYSTVAEAILAMESIEVDRTFGVGENGLIVCNSLVSSAGLSDESNISPIQIMPNPTSDWATLVYAGNNSVLVELHDIKGRKLDVPLIQSLDEAKIDLSDLSPGYYIVHWTDGNSSASIKVLKQ